MLSSTQKLQQITVIGPPALPKISHCIYWLTLGIILTALIAPFSIETVPPLLDYPIHLARSYIVKEYAKNPILTQMFDIDWRPLPNLASDLGLYWLSNIMKIEDAGRLLLCFCVVTTFFGVIFLHRINFGEWSWWPFLAALPAYHGAFTAGFVNYSIGLALLPFALGISIIAGRRSIILRLFADSVSALILYFCHIISAGLFGIFLFGHIFSESIKNKSFYTDRIYYRKLIFFTIPFLIPAFLYFTFSLSEVISRESYMAIGEWRFLPKLRGLIMPVLSGNYFFDIISLIFLTAIYLSFFWKKLLDIESRYLFGTFAIIIAFVLLPGHLLDAAFIMDRLPIAAVLILIAATNPLAIKRKQEICIIILLISLVTIRSNKLLNDWEESDEYLQRLTLAADNIEPGSSILIVSPLTHIGGKNLGQWHEIRSREPNWHFALGNIPTLHSLPAMPLIRRSAFCQIHFVWSDKQILSLTQNFQHLDYGDGGASTWRPKEILLDMGSSNLEFAKITDYFDYILILYANHLDNQLKKQVGELSPIYVDDEIILLNTPSKKSWRVRSLQHKNSS